MGSLQILFYVFMTFGTIIALIVLGAIAKRNKKWVIKNPFKHGKQWNKKSVKQSVNVPAKRELPKIPLYTLPEDVVAHYCEIFEIPVEYAHNLPDDFWQRLSETNKLVMNIGQQLIVVTQQRDEYARENTELKETLDGFLATIKSKRKLK